MVAEHSECNMAAWSKLSVVHFQLVTFVARTPLSHCFPSALLSVTLTLSWEFLHSSSTTLSSKGLQVGWSLSQLDESPVHPKGDKERQPHMLTIIPVGSIESPISLTPDICLRAVKNLREPMPGDHINCTVVSTAPPCCPKGGKSLTKMENEDWDFASAVISTILLKGLVICCCCKKKKKYLKNDPLW